MSISESTARHYTLQDPDVRLMLRVRDDDAAAFEQLVLRFQKRLLTVLEHHVGHRETAEDLTQEVFLRVWNSRKRYVPGAKFSTWLFTIANNVASNSQRNRWRRREVSTGGEGPDSSQAMEHVLQEASGLMPARQLAKAEMADIIRQAMDTLNERQRMAVLLCKFEEMSYADIAEAMNLTPQAIKSLLSRARNNLREILEPYLESGEWKGESGES